MAKGAPKEQGRNPKEYRPQVVETPDGEMVSMRVTETQNQRNAGSSIVMELENKGWVKPESPELLRQSPNGISFNMILPKAEYYKQLDRANRQARSMEGFSGEHTMIKEVQPKEETEFKGQELIDAMGLGHDN